MAATAGTAIFIGHRTGRTYVKDLYLSDTVNTAVRWDTGAGASATSPEKWTPPESVSLVDLSVVTGAAQTKLQVVANANPSGDMLRHTLQLNTLALRPKLNIPFYAGTEIAFIQLA